MVNKIVLYVFLFLGFAYAQNTYELFNSANRAYQNKEYGKAIKLYEEIAAGGYEGISLFYNLGNAYYRSGNLGYAILYYEKALKLSPGDDDIIHNLRIANARTVDKLAEFPSFFLFRWWEEILGLFSLSGWIYAAYILFIILLLCAAGYLLLRNALYQKYSFFAGLVVLVLFIFGISMMLVRLNRDENITKGVVVESVSNIKISPDETSNDAFVVHEGLKVRLEDRVGDWYKVKLEDGKTGWIPEKNIRII